MYFVRSYSYLCLLLLLSASNAEDNGRCEDKGDDLYCDAANQLSWCDVDDQSVVRLLEDPDHKCCYDGGLGWRGWKPMCNQNTTDGQLQDLFYIQQDCCGKDWKEHRANNLTIIDDVRETRKSFYFINQDTTMETEMYVESEEMIDENTAVIVIVDENNGYDAVTEYILKKYQNVNGKLILCEK